MSEYTPPASVYTSAAAFEQQKNAFLSSWQYLVCPEPETDSFTPTTLLPDYLPTPLLVHRERILSNVCTHRGARMLDRPGKYKTLRCPYHGRSFNPQGHCLSMPGFKTVKDFPSASDHLPVLQELRWGPLRFVALQTPGLSGEDWLAPVKEKMCFLNWEDFAFSPADSRVYELAAHWMLYCDNYLEGLHIPYVHPALMEALDFRDYETHILPGGVLQIGLASPGESAFALPPTHPDASRAVAAYYFWLFPNIMLNFYPWGLSLNLVEPVDPQQTRIHYLTWIADPQHLNQGAGGDVDTTEKEDHAVILRVQDGVQSPLYHRGRYAPEMEKGVRHFHHLLRQAQALP